MFAAVLLLVVGGASSSFPPFLDLADQFSTLTDFAFLDSDSADETGVGAGTSTTAQGTSLPVEVESVVSTEAAPPLTSTTESDVS